MNDNLCLYQLTDPFSLFHLRFIRGKRPRNQRYWSSNLESPSLSAWKGYAYELVCLLHHEQVKQALGVASISTKMSSWRSRSSVPGAQIDLLLDRKDDIINLCEMKYSKAEYSISGKYELELRNKIAVFEAETNSKKAVHLTMVTTYGVASNIHSGIVHSEVTLDDMCVFRDGIVKVSRDGRFGFINAKNEIVVPIEYDIAADLGRGIVMVSKGGVWSKSTSYDGGCYTEDEVYNKHSCQRIVPSISQRARRPLEKTGDAPFVMPVG